jgi:hypothetical protein
MPTTLTSLISISVKSGPLTLMRSPIFLSNSTNLKPQGINSNMPITCSLISITDGENQPEHGSHRLKRSIIKRNLRQERPLTTMTMIRAANMILNGLKTRNSLMLLIDLDILCSELNLLNIF